MECLWQVPLLRRAVYAAVDPVATVGTPAGLRAGRASPPGELAAWPVVLVVLLGADEVAARTVAEALGRAQAQALGEGCGLRPVFLVDQPVFAPLRRAGYAVEHLVPLQTWQARASAAGSWAAYAGERVQACRRSYRGAAVVCWRVAPGGADALAAADADALAAVVAASAPRTSWLRRRARRALAALQRRLDRST